MNKRVILYASVAALALAACNKEVEQTVPDVVMPQDDGALRFGAYVNRGTTTKAGWEGALNTEKLRGDAQGFGVFAYYNNGELYNEMSKPDFMYNQHVTYDGSNWTYSPLRYWPNEFGQNAASEEVDRLSFFAYAPWVQVNPATGIVNKEGDDANFGIIGMSRNTATGDPLIKYAASMNPGSRVDLCWGVAAADYSDAVAGASNSVSKGKPYLDVVKPTTESRIKFDFKHALAAVNIQIDADIDNDTHNHDTELDANTRIYVRSVSFGGFTTKGALNLKSEYADGATTPIWMDLAGTGKLSTDPVTVYDGRRDGKEGVETGTAKNETPANLNPDIVQSHKYTTVLAADGLSYTTFTSVEPGVTNTARNLFSSANVDEQVYVIPTEDDEVTITILYDVETADPTLSGYLSDGETHGVSVGNEISQTVKLASGTPLKLAAGKQYKLTLHLGLTSVKFDAEVSDWDDTAVETHTDLPYNTEFAVVDNQDKVIDWAETISATETTVTLPMRGLTAGKTLSAEVDPADAATVTFDPATVGEDGTATVTVTLAARGLMDQTERAVKVTVKQISDDSSEYQKTEINFKQEGAPEVVFPVIHPYESTPGSVTVDENVWAEQIPAVGGEVSFKLGGFDSTKTPYLDKDGTYKISTVSSWDAVMTDPVISAPDADGYVTVSFTIKPRTSGASAAINFTPAFVQEKKSSAQLRHVGKVTFTQLGY